MGSGTMRKILKQEQLCHEIFHKCTKLGNYKYETIFKLHVPISIIRSLQWDKIYHHNIDCNIHYLIYINIMVEQGLWKSVNIIELYRMA